MKKIIQTISDDFKCLLMSFSIVFHGINSEKNPLNIVRNLRMKRLDDRHDKEKKLHDELFNEKIRDISRDHEKDEIEEMSSIYSDLISKRVKIIMALNNEDEEISEYERTYEMMLERVRNPLTIVRLMIYFFPIIFLVMYILKNM